MRDFIVGLPKAELHVHIEGTLEPELMFELARRNGVELPYEDVAAARAAYDFGSLQDFLDLYYGGMSVLRTAEDFEALTRAYMERAHVDGVVHAEVFFDPQGHVPRGVAFDDVVDGIERALRAAGRELGMTSRMILCFLRDKSAADAMATLEAALPHRERIAAVGLDSAEVGNPPEKFRAVFDRAREEGFLTVAHAGEEGPPEYVTGALDALGVVRIDHGISCLGDPALVARLAEDMVPLTVCPLSNVKLKAVADMTAHPLRRMMEAGLMVTVNSDDPAYFGGYVVDNYMAVVDALGLTRDDVIQLARNSFDAAFMPVPDKRRHLEAIEAYAET